MTKRKRKHRTTYQFIMECIAASSHSTTEYVGIEFTGINKLYALRCTAHDLAYEHKGILMLRGHNGCPECKVINKRDSMLNALEHRAMVRATGAIVVSSRQKRINKARKAAISLEMRRNSTIRSVPYGNELPLDRTERGNIKYIIYGGSAKQDVLAYLALVVVPRLNGWVAVNISNCKQYGRFY